MEKQKEVGNYILFALVLFSLGGGLIRFVEGIIEIIRDFN